MSALDQFWALVGWVFTLNPKVFERVATLPKGWVAALIVVFSAGVAQAVAQSIILFINRVKPIRFIFSLLINTVLYVAGFVFIVLSTWLITLLPWTVHVPLLKLAVVIGIAYAPLVFSFLGALPYLGVPILTGLSIWHLLAMVVGVAAIATINTSTAFSYLAFGWIILQILQQTVGQPIADFGRWLADRTAGVALVRSRQELIELLRSDLRQASNPFIQPSLQNTAPASATATDESWGTAPAAQRSGASAIADPPIDLPIDPSIDSSTDLSSPPVANARSSDQSTSRATKAKPARPSSQRNKIRTVFGLLGMGLMTVCIVILLEPVREWLLGGYNLLPGFLQFGLDVFWIGVVAIVVSGLLAPLEALGWWAGWYKDEVDMTVNAGELATPVDETDSISRYIVYLDGIGKSTFEYLPDVEDFLAALIEKLPSDIALIRGIMPYSVLNNPLNEDRPLAFLWRLTEKLRGSNPDSLLGLMVNIRNTIIVAVSADQRYGPLYNRGIAQVVYNGLLKNGYQLGSSTPITLMGFSGGAQMAAACAPFLKRALSAPIDVISLGGVISGNCNVLELEHLYHLMGDRDSVEKLGLMFPGRWPLFFLSYWNRAKRRGKISIMSLGPVGHQLPGGMMDPEFQLADGRTALEQTVDAIQAALDGDILEDEELAERKPSNYSLYQQAEFNRYTYYPAQQVVSSNYRPISTWMGRLILPQHDERRRVRGVWFKVYHASPEQADLVGQVVKLQWGGDPRLQRYVRATRQDVHFSAEAVYTSRFGGLIHPNRLNHWQQVDPLESLAASHPVDDVIVALPENGVMVMRNQTDSTTQPEQRQNYNGAIALQISSPPMVITGRYYGLVQFQGSVDDSDQYRVIHFNPASRQFDGEEEVVLLPQVVADQNDSFPSVNHQVEASPLNETGWYIYGAQNRAGQFVVQSLAPRSLLRLQPERVISGADAGYKFIHQETWSDVAAQKGQIQSVLIATELNASPQAAIDDWQEGDQALLLHVYGGIGGKKKEPAAASPLFFGHFAYGLAEVVREPITSDLCFNIRYYQVYTNNTDGLPAGALHWSRYMGDRQFGWMGSRPVADILIKHDAFTGYYDSPTGQKQSPLNLMLNQLYVMLARYRIGDGTGGTYVGIANNCAQDSNRALFASLKQIEHLMQLQSDWLYTWRNQYPDQWQRFQQLIQLERSLKHQLQPFGSPRTDWERNEYNLGSSLEDKPIRNLISGLTSWRTLLPRLACDRIAQVFLQQGASVWVLRTNQVGGYDPDIEPIAPMTL